MSVVNSNPEIISTPLLEAVEDELYSYQVEATDWDGDILNIEPKDKHMLGLLRVPLGASRQNILWK